MLRAALLAVLVLFLAPAAARAADTRVYFTKGEQLAYVQRDLEAGPSAALTALLGGPTAAESAKGYGTAIPAGVTLTSAKVTGERVDVVLAGPFETDEPAFHARLAQVVYTATADSDIAQVRVLGKTYTREDFGPEPFTEPKPPTRKTAAPANPRDVQNKLASLGGDSPDIGTPSGKWKIYRKEVKSWSVPYKTWLPYAAYWVGGWALHGYADVPAQPASHGCARLPLPEAKIVYDFVSIGTPVQVI